MSNLQALGVHVHKLAQEALAGPDRAKGEAYARSVSQCGEALDRVVALRILPPGIGPEGFRS